MLTQEYGVSHLDINFGCPVRKITSRGGGAAIPLKPSLLESLVRAAVKGAAQVPVTIKMRLGISPEQVSTERPGAPKRVTCVALVATNALERAQESYVQAGRLAEQEGAAGVVLHTRYAEQLYAPPVHWSALQELSDAVSIPIIGNGDVYTAADCSQMLETGASGIMIGRACLGRPWVRLCA